MKIAILTQPLGKNYGGIMQAWALQQVLKNMGHEPTTIDRQPDARNLAYRGLRTVYRAMRRVVGTGNGLVFPERTLPVVTQHMREFIRANISMSPMIDSTEKLRGHFISESYEAVIVGSDQTWRPAYSPNIYNFFLDFLPDRNIKKLAYASSFGVDCWEFSPEQTRKCATLARDFDFISVREVSGIKLCTDYLGVVADAVLDPTLLLTADDYRALMDSRYRSPQSGRGLYCYVLDKTPTKNAIVQRISQELGVPAYMHQAEESLTDWKGGPIERYIMPPVQEWLSGFERADFVVTDSFHGMVFSIIFEKPFLAIANSARGAARFQSLLSQLGLNNRLIFDHQQVPRDIASNFLSSSFQAEAVALRDQSRSALELQLSHIGE